MGGEVEMWGRRERGRGERGGEVGRMGEGAWGERWRCGEGGQGLGGVHGGSTRVGTTSLPLV